MNCVEDLTEKNLVRYHFPKLKKQALFAWSRLCIRVSTFLSPFFHHHCPSGLYGDDRKRKWTRRWTTKVMISKDTVMYKYRRFKLETNNFWHMHMYVYFNMYFDMYFRFVCVLLLKYFLYVLLKYFLYVYITH